MILSGFMGFLLILNDCDGHMCINKSKKLLQIHGADKLEQAVSQRPEGQSLITVCNHVASMDDPLVMAALLPPSILIQAKNLRWTLCATDRCFTNAAFSAFFRSVKVLPLRRGAGLQQEVTTSTSWKNAIAIQNRVSQVT
jgi:1-acyl-sn-glycerol-3-phosphate acyltransferase